MSLICPMLIVKHRSILLLPGRRKIELYSLQLVSVIMRSSFLRYVLQPVCPSFCLSARPTSVLNSKMKSSRKTKIKRKVVNVAKQV